MELYKFAALLTGIIIIASVWPTMLAVNREVTIERINMLYINKSVCELNYTLRKVNRLDYGINVFLNLKQDFTDDYGTIVIQLYTLHSNEYRIAPLRIVRTTCSFLDTEWKLFEFKLGKYGNFPNRCPILKGLYYMKDFVSDPEAVLNFPWDSMRFDVNFTFMNQVSTAIQVFITINRNAILVNKFLGKKESP